MQRAAQQWGAKGRMAAAAAAAAAAAVQLGVGPPYSGRPAAPPTASCSGGWKSRPAAGLRARNRPHRISPAATRASLERQLSTIASYSSCPDRGGDRGRGRLGTRVSAAAAAAAAAARGGPPPPRHARSSARLPKLRHKGLAAGLQARQLSLQAGLQLLRLVHGGHI